ncbi:MAG: ThuA domain-containing protein [Planctomycetes bacterium]|nr:ThuA domain-containing protein [Planctomycetota bacterium]
MNALHIVAAAALALAALPDRAAAQQPTPTERAAGQGTQLWLSYRGKQGVGEGRHVVFVAAEQEYRAEQAMPMLAKLFAERHGFDTTVLFGIRDGLVDPTEEAPPKDPKAFQDIPGMHLLADADLLVLFTRFMKLPDEQLAHLNAYLDSGKPLIGIRTANHGFRGNWTYEKDGKKVRFGDDVLGGAFRGHYGGWHRESTRGVVVEANADHPILRGVDDVWGTSDVYRMFPEGKSLPASCTPLLLGQPLRTLEPDAEPNADKPPLPVAWTNTWTGNLGKTARVFHVTMGSARDYRSTGLRRLTLNAALWCLGLEAKITPDLSVEIVGAYEPLQSGFNYDKLGVKPQPVRHYR